MGEFERDKEGWVINKGTDAKGRKVNKAGYLTDDSGNVINKEGKKIFEKS